MNFQPKEKHLQANHEQNVADAIATLPQLLIGLDVNVRFRNVTDFEFTSNCIIFDLLQINLGKSEALVLGQLLH